MRDYYNLWLKKDLVATDFLESELFYDNEKSKAEIILGALDGMSIIQARSLLKRCERALQQAPFTA